jgi:hypothetical protein
VKNERLLWDRLSGPRLAVNLKGAEHHVTPSDAVCLAKGAVMTGSVGPDKTIAAIRSYIAVFLDANFWGQPLNPLLGRLSSAYPDVVVTTQRQSLGNGGDGSGPAGAPLNLRYLWRQSSFAPQKVSRRPNSIWRGAPSA